MGRLKASVIIPTCNRRDLVVRTITTLNAQTYPAAECEIIVVVDGSTDGTAGVLRGLEMRSRFRVIEQENRGIAGARNSGLYAAEGEVVVFVDDDMLCDPNLIAEHVAAHDGQQALLGFGAIFLSADSPAGLAAECFRREFGAYYLRQRNGAEAPAEGPPWVFSNTSVLRRTLLQAGGFDEHFRMREDAELAVRLLAAGLRPHYLKEAIAYQYLDKTIDELIRDAEAFAPADLMLASKHPANSGRTFLGRIAAEPKWKRAARRIVSACPAITDVVLEPVCRLSQARLSSGLLRDAGVRALQFRRGVHWYHRVLELRRSKK